MTIKVQTTTQRFWWGIHGLTTKNGYEDIDLFDDNGNLIDRIHLNAKGYLRAGLKFLKDDAQQLDYALAIEDFLSKDEFRFWYYYDDKNDEDFFEVPYEAPRNKFGVKPKAIEIWIPSENITIDKLKESVQLFANQFLNVQPDRIEVEEKMTKDQAAISYQAFRQLEKEKEQELMARGLKQNLSALFDNRKKRLPK